MMLALLLLLPITASDRQAVCVTSRGETVHGNERQREGSVTRVNQSGHEKGGSGKRGKGSG